jgi:hypothetical protein
MVDLVQAVRCDGHAGERELDLLAGVAERGAAVLLDGVVVLVVGATGDEMIGIGSELAVDGDGMDVVRHHADVQAGGITRVRVRDRTPVAGVVIHRGVIDAATRLGRV